MRRRWRVAVMVAAAAPASGELMLGINDDHLADNGGAYRVTVVTPLERLRRR